MTEDEALLKAFEQLQGIEPTEEVEPDTNEESEEEETEIETETEPEVEPTIEETEEEEGYDDEELNHITSQLYGASVEEIAEKLALLEQLESQQPSNELVFENDFQKSVYEYATKVPDITAEGASQLLAKAYFLNPEVADTRELLALNYRIANPELTEDEANIIFEDEFEAKYPDLDDLTDLQRTRLNVEIRKAKESINNFKQSNFAKTAPRVDNVEAEREKAEQMRIATDWINSVNTVATKLDALSFELDGGETLNFQIPDKRALVQRGETIEGFLAKYQTDKGIDANRFIQDVAKLENINSIIKEAFNQGRQQGVIEKTKEIVGVKPNIPTTPQAPTAPAPKTNAETLNEFAKALAGLG